MKTLMTCDIIIPTFNSASVLPRTLGALLDQAKQAQQPVRVLISDDGSRDATVDQARRLLQSAALPHLIMNNPHGGPARARNRALTVSRADLVLLLGADIILAPGALEAHFRFHRLHPDPIAAGLGFVAWDPRVRPTPFMEWMIHGGQQNDFDTLLGTTRADPRHCFYASHLSLKRQLLPANAFAEEFTGYGWEDLELGRRLYDRGIQLHVLHDARSWHHHRYTASDIYRRQRGCGRSLPVYQQRHPTTPLLPASTTLKHALRRAFSALGLLRLLQHMVDHFGKRYSLPHLFSVVTTLEFWQGVYQSRGDVRKKPSFPQKYPLFSTE